MIEMLSGLLVPDRSVSPSGLVLPSSVRDLRPRNLPGRHARFADLLVAERPQPFGNVGVYATPKAMNVRPVPFEEFISTLESIPLGMILPTLSYLLAFLHDKEMDPEAQQAAALGLFRRTPAFDAVARFLREGGVGRVAFSEQGITFLQLLAILVCDEDLTGLTAAEYAARIRWTTFFVPDFLEQEVQATAEDRSRWLRHLIRLFDYNGHPFFGNALARTWAIYGRLHREATDILPAVPLDDWLRRDYGLGLEQQLCLGFALFSFLGTNGPDGDQFGCQLPRATLESIFSSMGLTEAERKSAEELVAAPPSWFQTEVEGQDLGQLSWNRVPFMRRPLIRLASGDYVLQSPRALMSWIAEGVHYRCLDSAHDRDAAGAYTARLGKLTERYVLRLVESIHPEPRLPGGGKVYGDKKFGNGIDSSDVTLTYPNEVILMEVASRRLSLEAKRDGDQVALERDLTEMIRRQPKKIRRSIDAMKPTESGRATTLVFDRYDATRVARFWPLVITGAPVHWSPLLEDFLGEELGWLDGRGDIEALDVMPVEDLEGLVAIAEETGNRLADLLAAKRDAAGPHADVRTWLSMDRRPHPARPRFLDAFLDEAMNIAIGLLALPGDAEETAA